MTSMLAFPKVYQPVGNYIKTKEHHGFIYLFKIQEFGVEIGSVPPSTFHQTVVVITLILVLLELE